MTKRRCFIVDIDGTIADLTHRLHHVRTKGQKKDWDAFRKECIFDAPFVHMRELLNDMNGTIVYVSGRNECQRAYTRHWIDWHNFPAAHHLYMRADGDFRDDAIVKCELLQKLRADGFVPIMAFDDRDRVVKMWRDNGVPCAQVAPGDF